MVSLGWSIALIFMSCLVVSCATRRDISGNGLDFHSNNFHKGWNQLCFDNEVCINETKNSFCFESVSPEIPGTCQCLPNHIQYQSEPEDCDGHDGGSSPTGRISCLPLGYWLGDRCSVDTQCRSGAMGYLGACIQGTCQCLPGATHIFGAEAELLRWIPLNDTLCKLKAQNLGDSCLETIFYELRGEWHEFHLFSTECKDIPDSTCISNKCVCRLGTTESHTEPKRCVPAAERIGDSCEVDDGQCDPINGKCDTEKKICQCEETFVANENEDVCLGMVYTLNENCTENVQCDVANSSCEELSTPGTKLRTCQCRNGFLEINDTTCIPIRHDIGLECNDSIQCTTGLGSYSECVSNVCRCKENGTLYNGQCYAPVYLGEICHFHEQCKYSSSVTSDGPVLSCDFENLDDNNNTVYTCKCPSETHREYQGYCYELTGYSKFCESDEHCVASTNPDGMLICLTNNTCGCPVDYTINSDQTRCIKESVDLGGKCVQSKQCSDAEYYLYCDFESGTCKCKRDVCQGTITPRTTTTSGTTTKPGTTSTTTKTTTTVVTTTVTTTTTDKDSAHFLSATFLYLLSCILLTTLA